ncbi:MAG: 3-hydroxyanthranilate 3,4-dioxygenase [Chitinophagales bacterium]|jgi:3-hydroxyanthranilate 3,4-dioxygenase|nr:3-hydroxyanthranilate 3,4-dioxygenase [Chitinophagales bacterium]
MIQRAFNFKKWIDENRHLLKPPVSNKQVYLGNDDFIVMVVGGPNSRKDYHYNETEEFYYQLEGDVVVKIVEDGKFVDININEGDIFLLPPNTPHSPRRGSNTIGLVMEVYRPNAEDGFQWYCEQCGNLLHEEKLNVKDIVNDLPMVMNKFYSNEELRTCKNCNYVMEPPA